MPVGVAPGPRLGLVDARPAPVLVHELAEREGALLEHLRKAGPAVEAVATRVDAAFEVVRAELNERAGGQAATHVMLLAHNAQRAEFALELQSLVSQGAVGRHLERMSGEGADKADASQAEKGLRNLVGIAAFATDLLNKAYAAATEEGKAKRDTPVQSLMASLGIADAPGPAGGGSAAVPDLTGGVGRVEATPALNSQPNPEPPSKPRKKGGR